MSLKKQIPHWQWASTCLPDAFGKETVHSYPPNQDPVLHNGYGVLVQEYVFDVIDTDALSFSTFYGDVEVYGSGCEENYKKTIQYTFDHYVGRRAPAKSHRRALTFLHLPNII